MQVFAGQAEVSVAAQLGMMAGLQSFLSGGIAHHISLPREMTHAQQRDMLYAAWLCGLKQVCMYCPQPVAQPVSLPEATSHLVTVALLPRETQMAQPLMMQQPKTYAAREVIHLEPVSVMQDDPSMQASVDALADLIERHHDLLQTQQAEAKQEAAPSAPAMTQPGMHRPLPQRCRGYRQEVMIGDVVMHLQTGEYEDGTLGDIQVTLQNAAPDVQQQLQLLLNAVITGLQHGVPLEVYVQQFRGTRYAPSGMVQGNAQIPMASSLIDYLMQELAISYAQAKPRVSSSVVNEEMPVEQGAQDDAATLLAYTSLA
jgi:ribonucleoside-diphosphate reductase alpha chain